jgi:hypothetical protein
MLKKLKGDCTRRLVKYNRRTSQKQKTPALLGLGLNLDDRIIVIFECRRLSFFFYL